MLHHSYRNSSCGAVSIWWRTTVEYEEKNKITLKFVGLQVLLVFFQFFCSLSVFFFPSVSSYFNFYSRLSSPLLSKSNCSSPGKVLPNSFISSMTLPTTHTQNLLKQTSQHSRAKATDSWHVLSHNRHTVLLYNEKVLTVQDLLFKLLATPDPSLRRSATPAQYTLHCKPSKTLPATDKEATEERQQCKSKVNVSTCSSSQVNNRSHRHSTPKTAPETE